ncbi:EMB2654 [Symbiodinium natans]|uniref:EMB2654 protein n=1 Tax=Symbiodinium natans TaxID=878477 RepID=A0A812PDS5_9DINO|nr:EMB2654 [Symbiodinium natans]
MVPNIATKTSLWALPQVLLSLGRSRRWVEALVELERALSAPSFQKAKRPWAVHTACVNAALTACRLGRAWQVALEALQRLIRGRGSTPKPDHITFASCILALSGTSRWDIAFALMEVMRSHRVHMTTGVFNAGLICLQRSRQWQAALELLRGMDDEAIRPDLVSLNSVMASCSNATMSHWPLTLVLLHEARGRQGIGPLSTVSYNTTMAACGRASLWHTSLCLLEELRGRVDTRSGQGRARVQLQGAPVLLLDEESSPHPDRGCPEAMQSLLPGCNATLTGCDRASHWLKALNLLAAMHRGKDWPRPDVVSYNACINACEKVTSWTWALHLLASMQDSGQFPDAISLNSTALALTRATHWQTGLGLLCLSRKRSLELNAVSSLIIASVCGQGGFWQGALSEFRERWEDLRDDPVTQRNLYNATMSACEQSRRWREVLDLLFQRSNSLARDQVAINTAASACALHWEVALEVLQAHRTAPASDPEGAAGFGAVVLGCSAAAAWVWAVRLFHRASRQQGWWTKPAAAHVGGLAVAMLGAVQACETSLQGPTLRRLLQHLSNPHALSGAQLLLWELVIPSQGLKDEGLRAELADMLHRHNLSDGHAPVCRRLQSASASALRRLRASDVHQSVGFCTDGLERQFLPGSLSRGVLQGLTLTSRHRSADPDQPDHATVR